MDDQQGKRKKYRRFLVQIRKITRTKIFVYFLCVFCSFCVWITLSLSQQKFDSFELNIRFTKHPKNFTLINHPQSSIFFNATSSGYDLQTLHRKKEQILDVDVSEIKLNKVDNQFVGVLYTNKIENEIKTQLMYKGAINQITPDSIVLIYEKNITKQLPVSLNVDYQLARQYWMCCDPIVSPKIISIEGLPCDLDSLYEIKTIYKNLEVLSDTFNITLSLIKPDTKFPVSISDDSVQLTIPVEQFTEKQFVIPITSSSSDKNFKIKTFPEQVTVYFLVSLKQFDQISEEMFQAEVVYNDSFDKNSTMLPVKITKKPNFGTVSMITPKKVEYILIKK